MSRATLWEIALAVVVTAVIAAGPLTPNEWGPSLLIGAAVAGAVVVVCSAAHYRAPIR